jgi:manganese transport protein
MGLLRSQRVDVVVAMSVAGVINLSMLVVAAKVLSTQPTPVDTIEEAHAGLATALGPTAALLFALALLASGFAASGVGTYSGQVVMQGFLRRRIPLVVRRLVTLTPAVVIIAAGVDPTRALVGSQVVLSFGIPFALVPLVLLTRRRDVMGGLVNNRTTTVTASAVATVICCLNVTLIGLTLAG